MSSRWISTSFRSGLPFVPSYDLTDMVTGKALYGMDARVAGMVYASIEHPPVFGGTVKSYDDKAPLKVTGVRQVVEMFKQICEEAGERQVPGAKTVMTFNMGGSLTTSVAMIWGKP